MTFIDIFTSKEETPKLDFRAGKKPDGSLCHWFRFSFEDEEIVIYCTPTFAEKFGEEVQKALTEYHASQGVKEARKD